MKRKEKEGILLLAGVLGMLLIIGITFINSRERMIEQQKAAIGSLYEKDPDACEFLLQEMFSHTEVSQEQTVKEQKMGEQALIEFGYTGEGLEYLYQQNEIYGLHVRGFVLLFMLAIGIFALFFLFERGQQKEEEVFVKDIRRYLNSDMEFSTSKYSAYDSDLMYEISKLIKAVFAKEQEVTLVRKRTQDFVENIAHQIKTPLTCISVSMDLLSEKVKDETEQEYIRQSFTYLQEIELLMKKLLDIGRLEAGKILMKKEALSLESLLMESAAFLDPKEERFEIVSEQEEAASLEYYGDYNWLKEAFTNLLKNCMEHDSSGEKIRIRLVQKKENIFIQIRDYGTGFAKEDLMHIFDRFYLPEAAKKFHTGIGLNLAALVIKKHFGMIEAGNHPEGGAVFSIVFPNYGMKNEKVHFS